MNRNLEKIVDQIGIQQTIRDLAVICSNLADLADDAEAWIDLADQLDDVADSVDVDNETGNLE